MPYKNAANIFPPDLLAEVQKYVHGEQVYVPSAGDRARWGEKNGTRHMLAARDREILQRKRQGASLSALADEFGLSEDRIQKIVYRRPK